MFATRSPWKRWLILGVIVLLVHLALLQSMPTDITPAQPTAALPLTFSTRSIDTPSAVAPLMPSPKNRTLRPKAARRPTVQPVIALPEPPLPVTPAAAETPSPQAPDQLPMNNAGEIAATPARPSASEPEPAQVTPTEPAPQQDATAPPPPRDKPLRFNAQSLSASKKLIYTLKTNKFPFTLNAELLWRNRGDSYSARLRYSAFGIARLQTSQGQITDAGLAPERFSDKYRSEVAAHFNYEQHKVTFSANTPDAPLLAGAQDRLSVLLQLGGLLSSEPTRYETGRTITVQTVGARAADLWLFTVIGTETLVLPGGTVQAVRLERLPREPYDQKVEVWLSPDLYYLPVRLRITEANGDSADQQWSATESADGAD
jgi:Protein of unknown function (DUF3108)